MQDKKGEAQPLRRDFMKLTAASAVGGAVAMVASSPANAAKAAEGQQSGYRETEHVKRVYALSRF